LTSPNWSDGQYSLLNSYLFKGNRLCLPHTSIREFVIRELHVGGLAGHFGRDKTIALVEDRFYWPHLKHDVFIVLKRCRTCQLSKGIKTNAGLYSPLPILNQSWGDISMDFVLGLPRTVRGYDSIFVVVDHSQRWHIFFLAHELMLLPKLHLFFFFFFLCFSGVVRLRGLPKTIVFDRDVKFVSYFWKTLWANMGTKLKFSSAFHPQTDGQTEAINWSLGNLLRCLVTDHQAAWDLLLPRADRICLQQLCE